MKLAVLGATGRMGKEVARLCASAEHVELIGGVASQARAEDAAVELGYPLIVGPEEAPGLMHAAEVVLDFSSADALGRALERGADSLAGRALVVGTTGLDEPLRNRLEALERECAVLAAANFSLGVNLLLALAESAARALSAEAYDVEVVEAHHRRKADAPSGTALALAQAVARGRGVRLEEIRRDGRSGRTGERPAGEIGLHALRGGGVAGEHQVLFLGERERVELVHRAEDRSLFAAGALEACRWIAGRAPGRYSMADVLEL